jgi:16S rRNA (cytidine1402-2'-O)-methyltransferase
MSTTQPTLNDKTPKEKGILYLLATSLGHPLDIPARSLSLLKDADVVVFEEPKPARQFLKAAGVHREFLCFSEHQQVDTLAAVVEAIRARKVVAYMPDQGSPNFADPGSALVKAARQNGGDVRVVPGPNSVAAAISACPFSLSAYIFAGFLPRESEKRIARLENLAAQKLPLVILDTPYRLTALLEDVERVFGKQKVFLAKEIGQENESYNFSPAAVLKQGASKDENFVLVVPNGAEA